MVLIIIYILALTGLILLSKNFKGRTYNSFAEEAGEYGIAFLKLSIILIRADKVIYNVEVKRIQQQLEKLYGFDLARDAMELFKKYVKADIWLSRECEKIKKASKYEALLQLVYFLFELAKRDKPISNPELKVIKKISEALKISDSDFISMKAMFMRHDNTFRDQLFGTKEIMLQNAYNILGVNKDSSMDEIKKTYHLLAKKHHPDKISYLGESFIESANRKFQEIVNAYELVRMEKGR